MRTEFIEQVKEFMTKFKQPVIEKPAIPSKERQDLRIKLLQEELDELKQAIDDNDLIGVIDAFCDLQYVLSGAIIEFGLSDMFLRCFNEVQSSNMSKLAYSREEVDKTIEKYAKLGIETYGKLVILENNEKYFIIYRSSDNKVLKSINFVEPNFKHILNEYI